MTFFRGAGVAEHLTIDLQRRVTADRASVSKYEITRAVLTRINEGGDRPLAQRREVVKRVTEFEDFSAC
jgi:restriction system protein